MNRAASRPPDYVELLAARLIAERAEWFAFLRRRVATDADAEDLLQSAFLKALRHVGDVRSDENVTAWFYRLLRHAVADHYRMDAAEQRRRERWHGDLAVSGDDRAPPAPDEMLALCGCLLPRLKALKPRYAQLIWMIDLEGRLPAEVAEAEKTSLNVLNVSLHRARQSLRRELERFCGKCAETACLDCGCPPGKKENASVRFSRQLRRQK